MADSNKTQATDASVTAFIDGLTDERKQADARRLVQLMAEASGQPATMWGGSIVGFGSYHYRYASGREGDFLPIGFSPRASAISLYIYGDNAARASTLARLGKHTVGKNCVYVKKLADIDEAVLLELIEAGLRDARAQNPT